MKTNIFKKSTEVKNIELLEMSKEELKSIEGGIWYFVRNPDGTLEMRYKRENEQ